MRLKLSAVAVLTALVGGLIFLQPAAAGPSVAVYRVMPMGDSVTWGYTIAPNGNPIAGNGYRQDLWVRLRNVGLTVDFVGPCPDANMKCPLTPSQTMGDHNHTGHSGRRIDQLAAEAAEAVERYQPHAVLLHVGTNDMAQRWDMPNAPARLSDLIDRIQSAKPGVRVFVATPVYKPSRAAEWKAYRDAIPGVVAAQGPLVHLVPQHIIGADFRDLGDGTHPTPCGYARMAYVWYYYMGRHLSSGWWPTAYYPFGSPTSGVCAS